MHKFILVFKCLNNLVPNKPFQSSRGPLFQNEGRCSAFDMEIIFHSHANKTHFHKKGVRVLELGSGLLSYAIFYKEHGSTRACNYEKERPAPTKA